MGSTPQNMYRGGGCSPPPGQAGPGAPGSRTGDRHPPTEETTTKLILKIFSKEGIFFPPGEEGYIIVSYVERG